MNDRYTTALSIIQKLVENGFTAYFAGGWVRDFLMKKPSDDIDIVTNAPLETLPSLFSKTIPVGVQFGILIVVENGFSFEVAIFRKEEGYQDGRRPTSIEVGTPEEDAMRRDFTINGMFYDPLKEILYDYVGGQKDLQKEVIRAIGDPHERFREDRLRMIRAVRYAARFHFAIDPNTIQAILAHARELFPAVAIERVVQEFVKMEKFGSLQEALLTLHRLHLLSTIFPALQNVEEGEVERRLKHLSSFPREIPVIVPLLELFPDMNAEEKEKLCLYLKLSRQEISFVELLNEMMIADKNDLFRWAHLYASPGADLVQKVHIAKFPKSLEEHRQRRSFLEKAIQRIRENRPVVQSSHLLARGVAPGKEMGRLLKEAEKISITSGIDDPEAILPQLDF